jgi:hypothetical protein
MPNDGSRPGLDRFRDEHFLRIQNTGKAAGWRQSVFWFHPNMVTAIAWASPVAGAGNLGRCLSS